MQVKWFAMYVVKVGSILCAFYIRPEHTPDTKDSATRFPSEDVAIKYVESLHIPNLRRIVTFSVKE